MGSILGSVTSIFGGGQSSGTAPAAASMADPFASQRGYYANQLYNLWSNPNAVSQSPGFQFELGQGSQAVQGSNAARGMLNSGGTASALQQFGTGLASQDWLQQLGLLSTLSGATTGSPAAAGSLYQSGQQNYQSGLNQGIGSLFNMFGGSGGGSSLLSGLGGLFGGGGNSATGPYADGSGYTGGSSGGFDLNNWANGGNGFDFSSWGGG